MKRKKTNLRVRGLSFGLFSLLSLAFLGSSQLHAENLVKNTELLGITPDVRNIPEHRKCGEFKAEAGSETNSPSPSTSYSFRRMQGAMKGRLSKMKKVLDDISSTHRSFVKAYPQFVNYHEVEIEDLPQREDRLRQYANLKVTVAFHYRSPGELDCVIIDAYERKIYEENEYTRKLFRFPYADIEKLVLTSLSYNYKRETLLSSYSLADQFLVIRTVFRSLLKALYKMDMIMASYNHYQRKINRWQGDI